MAWTPIGTNSEFVTDTVTIPSIGSIMAAGILMRPFVLQRIQMPAAWTAAGLTFQVSVDNSTYVDLYIGGSETSFNADVDRGIGIDMDDALKMGPYLKIRSGTAGTPVNQAAERTLTLYARRLRS
jgi:hypothetical protein